MVTISTILGWRVLSMRKKAMSLGQRREFPRREGLDRPGREADERLICEALGRRRFRELAAEERLEVVQGMPKGVMIGWLKCINEDLGIGPIQHLRGRFLWTTGRERWRRR